MCDDVDLIWYVLLCVRICIHIGYSVLGARNHRQLYTPPRLCLVVHDTYQLGTTGICPHRSNQPTQDSNPGPSDHELQTQRVSPPSEDYILYIHRCVFSHPLLAYIILYYLHMYVPVDHSAYRLFVSWYIKRVNVLLPEWWFMYWLLYICYYVSTMWMLYCDFWRRRIISWAAKRLRNYCICSIIIKSND